VDTQDFHLGDDDPDSVTPYDEATSQAIAKREAAAERKRLERDRRKAAPIIHETADWRLFLDPETLPQKAGCQPDDIGKVVLKELVDNALDAGASVTVQHAPESRLWIVTDNGPGLDPDDVARLFCVNRPLLSSKLKRMPTRGMLGNGLRVVMAWAQVVFITSRGVSQRLEIDQRTGRTIVTRRDNVPAEPGMTVKVRAEDPGDDYRAKITIALAKLVPDYTGPSNPHWYGYSDFARLFSDAPASASAGDVVADLGLVPPKTLTGPARDLTLDAACTLLRELKQQTPPLSPDKIGRLGLIYPNRPGYKRRSGIRREPAGGHVPYVIEAHVNCKRADKRSNSSLGFSLTINKSASLVEMLGGFNGDEFLLQGCGLDLAIKVPTGIYSIALSIITVNLQLTSDGKAPALGPYADDIAEVIESAMRQAHQVMERPDQGMSIKQAAYLAFPNAYEEASGGKALSPSARQVFYAARPRILELTGKDTLDSKYITQNLLPNFETEHPEPTQGWDVTYDARGNMIEPHTGIQVGLGTLEVRDYLRDRAALGPAIALVDNSRRQTVGPENRYRTVLFVEKEGFHRQIQQAQIQERFDVMLMSTKGMSVVAARKLLDDLAARAAAGRIDKVLVAHDFDISGFGIFTTLGTDSRRYTFTGRLPLIDIGLRLTDIREMNLESEPVAIQNWAADAERLAERGATAEELDFMAPNDEGQGQRVELNAMTAPQFVAFLERKLTQHGAGKVVPDESVLIDHAQRILTREAAAKWLATMPRRTTPDAPADLVERVRAMLVADPALAWDDAVALLLRD
jgi:hypothetical protein